MFTAKSDILFRGLFVSMILAASLNLVPDIAQAQQSKTPVQEEIQPKAKTLPPAYNNQMLRLAEILGAIHYLRNLCGADEGMLWRNQMENIINNEEPSQQRKADLIGRFNRGFRSYREIYRECTPTAVEAVNLYLRHGTRLAGEIPDRYGR